MSERSLARAPRADAPTAWWTVGAGRAVEPRALARWKEHTLTLSMSPSTRPWDGRARSRATAKSEGVRIPSLGYL